MCPVAQQLLDLLGLFDQLSRPLVDACLQHRRSLFVEFALLGLQLEEVVVLLF